MEIVIIVNPADCVNTDAAPMKIKHWRVTARTEELNADVFLPLKVQRLWTTSVHLPVMTPSLTPLFSACVGMTIRRAGELRQFCRCCSCQTASIYDVWNVTIQVDTAGMRQQNRQCDLYEQRERGPIPLNLALTTDALVGAPEENSGEPPSSGNDAGQNLSEEISALKGAEIYDYS